MTHAGINLPQTGIEANAASSRRHLRAENLSPKTTKTCGEAIDSRAAFESPSGLKGVLIIRIQPESFVQRIQRLIVLTHPGMGERQPQPGVGEVGVQCHLSLEHVQGILVAPQAKQREAQSVKGGQLFGIEPQGLLEEFGGRLHLTGLEKGRHLIRSSRARLPHGRRRPGLIAACTAGQGQRRDEEPTCQGPPGPQGDGLRALPVAHHAIRT